MLFENHPQDSRVTGPHDVAPSCVSQYGTGGGNVPLVIPIMPQAMQAEGWRVGKENQDGRGNGLGVGKDGDPCPTLDRSAVPAIEYSFDSLASNSMKSSNPVSGCNVVDVAKCIDTSIPCPSKNQGGIAVAMVNMQGAKSNACIASDGSSFTLMSGSANTHAVTVAPTITATNDPSRSPQSSEITQQVAAVHASTMQVRRLTPTECERLQGFPDGWTAIPWKKKPADQCPDGPRYKALGNSMAVNCMEWLGERIQAVESGTL
jgi:DNA (cytosine-5)-methyltransferase 1